MALVNTCLAYHSQTEEAFSFYAKTVGTDTAMITRNSDTPATGHGEPPVDEQSLVLHAELPIIDGHALIATEMSWSMGEETRIGNNTTPCIEVDNSEEVDRPSRAVSEGAPEGSPIADMPWSAYWSVIIDHFGIRSLNNHALSSGPFSGQQPVVCGRQDRRDCGQRGREMREK